MSVLLESRLRRLIDLRRLAWRAGRRLYCAARGEPRRNAITENGEAYVQRRVVAALPPGETLTAIDVGANQGDWSRTLLDALRASRRDMACIHAFEPVPATRERLRATLAAHPLGGLVLVEEAAVSDVAGRARIASMCPGGGIDSLHAASSETPPGGWIEVETCNLASFFDSRNIGRAHLVKSDAEGHDSHVLRGAVELLRAERIDVLQFEYNHRWVHARAFLKDVFDLVAPLPYSVVRIAPDGVELLESWHFELERFFEANYLLIRRPALDWFACRRGSFDGSNTYA